MTFMQGVAIVFGILFYGWCVWIMCSHKPTHRDEIYRDARLRMMSTKEKMKESVPGMVKGLLAGFYFLLAAYLWATDYRFFWALVGFPTLIWILNATKKS